uniref:Secreted protein n=1 Tax=Bursaphelenchus xylophilus TaxID=6326 RepID=A0A1I7RR00_BURXY
MMSTDVACAHILKYISASCPIHGKGPLFRNASCLCLCCCLEGSRWMGNEGEGKVGKGDVSGGEELTRLRSPTPCRVICALSSLRNVFPKVLCFAGWGSFERGEGGEGYKRRVRPFSLHFSLVPSFSSLDTQSCGSFRIPSLLVTVLVRGPVHLRL